MQHLLQMLRGASPVPFYLLVGASAAVQNIVPLPIADLAVLFAAFLMTAGHSTVFGVFLAAWLGNAGLACLFFVLARRYGAGNPNARLVRWVLRRAHAREAGGTPERPASAHRAPADGDGAPERDRRTAGPAPGGKRQATAPVRWDLLSIFVASFLPVRPLLPVYAGLGRVAFWRLILPVGAAAGAWYAGIVLIGVTGGKNFRTVLRAFSLYSREFTIAVLALTAVAVGWWWLRRHRRHSTP